MRPYEADGRGAETVFAADAPYLFAPAGDDRIVIVTGYGTGRIHVGRVGRPVDLFEGRRQRYWSVRVLGTKAIVRQVEIMLNR
jgi:hypothetical protein